MKGYDLMAISFIKSKKGFELAFNWIFVLLAGFIILMFFFSFMRNHYSDVKIEESLKSQSDIDFLFSASQGSRSSEKIISFPSTLTFNCADGTSQYLVEGSNVFSSYNHLAVFTPVFLKKSDLLVKTESFDSPFSIMPVTYITNKRVQYVFLGETDDPTLLKLSSYLPKNSTRKFYSGDFTSFKNEGFDIVIFITNSEYFDNNIKDKELNPTFKNNDYNNVFLISFDYFNSVIGNPGNLHFYKYELNKFDVKLESYFLNDVQLSGAMISGEGTIYDCQFKKMNDKFNLLSSLHKERISSIKNSNSFPLICMDYYSEILDSLSTIEDITSQKIFDEQKISSLFQSIRQISLYNVKLARDSCIPVY